jgi:hypothetical protein
LTTGTLSSTFGARSIADSLCASDATAAGLPGTFVSWISITGGDAIDRLAGSRGWVRTDGLELADTPEALVAGEIFNPLDVDASGAAHPSAETLTGTGPDGRLDTITGNCGDWTVSTASTEPGDASSGMPDFSFSSIGEGCTGGSGLPIYCFEVGHDAVVRPSYDASTSRLAFLSSPWDGVHLTQMGIDSICSADATAAGLPGTYLSATATPTASVASRFTLDSRAWRRIDGTLVAAPGNMFSGPILSFVNQSADGTYLGSGYFPNQSNAFVGADTATIVGSASSTCGSWSVTDSTLGFVGGGARAEANRFWGAGEAACSTPLPFICLEQ